MKNVEATVMFALEKQRPYTRQVSGLLTYLLFSPWVEDLLIIMVALSKETSTLLTEISSGHSFG